MDAVKIYTTGEVIDKLGINQLAIQVEGEEEFATGGYVALSNGSSIYYDPSDFLLKSSNTGEPIVIFKPKDLQSSKWIIVDC